MSTIYSLNQSNIKDFPIYFIVNCRIENIAFTFLPQNDFGKLNKDQK